MAAQDTPLLRALGLAHHWQRLLDEGRAVSVIDIAEAEGMDVTQVRRVMRLTLLDPELVDRLEGAPDILELLMAGRQPRRMNLIWFQRNPLPVDWEAQRQIVKRFEEDA